MQSHLESLLTKKYLIAALVASTFVNLVSNLLGKDTAILVGNITYIPTVGSLLVLAFLMIRRYGLSGQHGLAWILFGGYAITAFIAETLWAIQELYLKIDPFPSTPDIFYLISYPFLLMFFVAYFQPVRSAITKRMLAGPIAFSLSIYIAGLYFTIGSGSDLELFPLVLGMTYPAFDSLIIIPALVGVSLFFKGKVNFMWALFCFGMIVVFAADMAFLFAQNGESYYTGNPLEMLFTWSYILFVFGVHNHLEIFQKSKTNKLEDLR